MTTVIALTSQHDPPTAPAVANEEGKRPQRKPGERAPPLLLGTQSLGASHLLDDFTKRNMQRFVRVEVDDLALGAQVQAAGYVLWGITFDPRDRRVDVMLAAPVGSHVHLTRTIPGVFSIALTRDNAGRDSALQMRTEESERW